MSKLKIEIPDLFQPLLLSEEEQEEYIDVSGNILINISTKSEKAQYLIEHNLEKLDTVEEIKELKQMLKATDCLNCAGRIQAELYALRTGIVEPYFDFDEFEAIYVYTDRYLEEIARSYI